MKNLFFLEENVENFKKEKMKKFFDELMINVVFPFKMLVWENLCGFEEIG